MMAVEAPLTSSRFPASAAAKGGVPRLSAEGRVFQLFCRCRDLIFSHSSLSRPG
jgi:hypothetical protein